MEPPKMNRLVDLLKETGWTTREAKCYCKLVELGPKKASEIAQEINIRKAKVYEPLNKLEERGYVKIRDEKPKLYMAQNPRFVIQIENENMRKRSKEILKGLEEVWEIQEETSGEEDNTAILRKRSGKETELLNMIEETEETLVGAELRRVTATRKFREKIKEKAKDLEIKLIGSPRSKELLKKFQEAGVKTKTLQTNAKFSYYVADNERVLLSIQNEKITITFEEEQVASIFMSDFEDLFEKAKPLEEND
ncbi:MAG: hypothetical protein KGY45_03605 [Hadesarchaea archaeon]|nr:hypothetical protein [Hadesarchaea archaeon]